MIILQPEKKENHKVFEAKIKSLTIIVAATLLSISAFAQVGGTVVDQADGSPVAGAAVTIKGNQAVWDVTDSLGRFKLKATGGTLQITCLGYKTLITAVRKDGRYSLAQDSFAINEVVVTATESHGLTSSSRIGQDAIAHIQPSSFADLLELLPGGRSVDPSFSTPKTIDLRAVSVSGDNYNTSSLGTRFLIDGVPVNNDANLQTTPAYSNYGSSFVNAGVDMRTITTEDVESVEIIRGIPSVEYGDLTSGLVNIKRRKGGNDTRARFKADMKSKLFYLGKDLEWGKTDKLTMNFSGNFLDSRADPRNTRQNYKRLTGSYRIGKTWTGELVRTLSGSLDYTGSFDNQKSDKNLDFGDCGPIETYKSNYSRFALGGEYTVRSKSLKSFFQSLDITGSLTYEKDLIDRWKFVEYSSPMPLSTSLEEGEFDVTIVPYKYEATLKVDGKPFYAYLNGTAKFRKDLGNISNTFKAGAQWNVNKNFGKGTIFDPERPFSVDMNVRPRDYSSIPATHQISAFIEDNSVWTFGNGFKAEWLAGVRVAAMAGAGKEYSVNMKPYFDPRLNLRLEKSLGKDVKVGLSGGAGWHTKFPTMDQLYPDPIYYDVTQMNYWPVEENLRRINVYVLKINPTNFGLKAARNFKWEIAADVQVGREFSFNIDYFREDMTSGFRYASEFTRLIYKDYQEETIDKSTLTGPPSVETTLWVPDTLLVGYSFNTNGSRTLKEGIEFTLSAPRIRPIRTKVTVSGAWFRTRYSNSQPTYYRPSVVVAGKTYPYVGYYKDTDGFLREVFNTNFMFDTQIPKLGMIFSTSFQCQWFTGSQNTAKDARPISYIDKNLESHPFTDESAANGILAQMIREYTPSMSIYFRIPFSMNINLKATKKIYHDKISCALFVNKILDVSPDYRTNMGILVRRSVLPYFGMELNFKL